MKNKKSLLAIVGPTAVGKSKLALELAMEIKAEIISADSMQVYKHMDIGTAKPSKAEQKSVRHHLIDMVYPDQEYNVGKYRDDATSTIDDILDKGKIPLLVGGTGLYIRAIVDGLFEAPKVDKTIRKRLKQEAEEKGLNHLYNRLKSIDPEASIRINFNDQQRIIRALEFFEQTGGKISKHQANHKNKDSNYDLTILGISKERDKLYDSINQRVDKMIERGLIDEVKGLLDKYDYSCHPMQGLGYKHIGGYILGHYTLAEGIRLMKRDTRRYAKRQFTWFNRDKRIQWFEGNEIKKIKQVITERFEKNLR